MEAKPVTCAFCKRKEAIFYRQYSGERLCKKCFGKSIEDKTKATISKYKMLKFNDKIAVAVSGGKDSVTMLHILTKMERCYPQSSLVAITVDEGIAGYREEALSIAIENCNMLGIEHHIVSFKELFGYTLDEVVKLRSRESREKTTPCAYCGILRRRALNIASRKIKANKLATAHTLDDETQTILLNIFHGDVWRLAREKPATDEVHPKLVQRIKPFCEIPEKETTLYAYIKNMKFQSEPCPYASEALRNDVRNMLNRMEHNHSGIKFTVFNSIEKIRPALEVAIKKEGLGECKECGEPTTEELCNPCKIFKMTNCP